MSLYPPSALQDADPLAAGGSWAAIDAALDKVLGQGVIDGLTVDGSGNLLIGHALIGHVMVLATNTSVLPCLGASGTYDVYLQMPTFAYSGSAGTPGTYPAATGATAGMDSGVIVAVTHGSAAPPNAVLCATVVGSSSTFTSANNSPAGRVTITAISVTASAPLVLTAGNLTITAATDSAAGSMSAADKTKLDGIGTIATAIRMQIDHWNNPTSNVQTLSQTPNGIIKALWIDGRRMLTNNAMTGTPFTVSGTTLTIDTGFGISAAFVGFEYSY